MSSVLFSLFHRMEKLSKKKVQVKTLFFLKKLWLKFDTVRNGLKYTLQKIFQRKRIKHISHLAQNFDTLPLKHFVLTEGKDRRFKYSTLTIYGIRVFGSIGLSCFHWDNK